MRWMLPLVLVLWSACKPEPEPADDSGDTDTVVDDTGTGPGDFTVQTTEGPWSLKQSWSGCDSYLFIPDDPAQATGWPEELWGLKRDTKTLFERLPPNVQVFFVSGQMGQATRDEALAALKADVDAVLENLGPEYVDHWTPRVHYLTDRSTQLEGWLGETFVSPNWGTAIDRFQTIRYIGSFADPSRYNSSYGWFEPNLSMAANEAVYYNFESDRDERLAAQGATVIPTFRGEQVADPHWAGARGYADLELPDAATMATFDTLELDLTLGCVGDGEYGSCPAWDYLVYLYLCDAEDPDDCSMEFGRWITTYHRDGRWTIDASNMLPYLAEGGTRRVAFYTQQPYEVRLDVRLYDAGKPVRPEESTHLFSGGYFGVGYNTREPVTVFIPADATKVELATTISGHGQVTPGNCAEFCDTEHYFYVNGNENLRSFPDAGAEDACMEATDEGTVPNQYGTWWYGRSGWCPGKEVPVVYTDVTAQVTLGADNVFEYYGYRNGAEYTGSGAWIDLQAWVVVSR